MTISSSTQNPYILSLQGCSSLLDISTFSGHETLSKPFTYNIYFSCVESHLKREQFLLKPAALSFKGKVENAYGVPEEQVVRVVRGVVTSFKRLNTSRDETHYYLSLQPRLSLLEHTRQNTIYQDMSVAQIIDHILRDRHQMRGQDFVFHLSKDYPRREQVMQYDESDLAFITRLCSEVGIWFRFIADLRLGIDVVEFYDSRQGYQTVLNLPAISPSGQNDQGVCSVWKLESHHHVVPQEVHVHDYNYRQAPAEMHAQIDITGGDPTTYGKSYHYADNYLSLGDRYDPHPEAETGVFYGRIRHERYLNNQNRLNGFSNSPNLAPGLLLKVTGGEEVAESFITGAIITDIRTQGGRSQSYSLTFEGLADSSRYSYRPPLPKRRLISGTLPARVTSTKRNDPYSHIDKHGRYKVNMLFDRTSWKSGQESLWVRQSRPYAGASYGLHLPLLAGTEVAIGFEDGNPDRPYIAGVLHDSSHQDHVTIENYKRNVLRTPSNNKLRLDDSKDKEHIKLSTEHGGKSQLNLGHLVDEGRQLRGEGFELRTDSWGSIRAQKGLMISTEAQPKAKGLQREMQPALSDLKAAHEQMSSLSKDANKAHAGQADVQAQIALLEQKLSDLKRSVIMMRAPEGVALSSGEHMQLSAAGNMMTTAGGSHSTSVVKNFFIGVGETLSLFARKCGIKMIANQGKVEIAAQNDALSMLARQGLTITSTEGEIIITAKKRIKINGGGSYLVLNESGIWSATNGIHYTHAADYKRMDKKHQPEDVPNVDRLDSTSSNRTLIS